jgi:Tfp pilus assembly protein PilV
VSALVLAVLYFGLMELLWFDASERLRAAQRFRSRIQAQILAENAAELAAANMIIAMSSKGEATLPEGTMNGIYTRSADGTFSIEGRAETSGVWTTRAEVFINGRIDGTEIIIERTLHRP